MKKYYIIENKKEVELGESVNLNGFNVKITEQLINDNPDKFQVINKQDNDDLLEEAKRKYPIGTKFRSVLNKEIYVVHTNSHRHHSNGIDVDGIPWLYLDGKWAEIVEERKVIYHSQDEYDIFEGETFFTVNDYYDIIEVDVKYNQETNHYDESYPKFKTYERVLEYKIEKIEDDLECTIIDSKESDVISNYYTLKHFAKVFNGDWKPTEHNRKYIVMSDFTVDSVSTPALTDVCFKSEELAEKAINLLKLLNE